MEQVFLVMYDFVIFFLITFISLFMLVRLMGREIPRKHLYLYSAIFSGFYILLKFIFG
ncbi:hypothetical protein RJG79_06630 [Mycoplasmatota bacterium WC44]